MKIGLVSTYPPTQCGIAAYTRKLSAALTAENLGLQPLILAEMGGAEIDPAIPCTACFTRHTDFPPVIAATADRLGLAVVHFQHAPDIFGVGNRMLRAVEQLRHSGVAVAVTLHTVFTRMSGLVERKPFAASFHRRLSRTVDTIIVHSETSRQILAVHGVPEKLIELIPHGTDDPRRGDPAIGRELLGVGDSARVLLFFGFVHMQKNVHVLLKALVRVVRRAPDVKLAIVGKPGGDAWYNRAYARWLARLARRLDIEQHVVIIDRFVNDEEAADIHAAALAVMLPHAQGYGSASGVVHNAMAQRLPVLCSDSIKFDEVATNVSPELLVPTRNVRAWADKMLMLLENDAWHELIVERVEKYARATRWPEVGRRHERVYRRIAADATRTAGANR